MSEEFDDLEQAANESDTSEIENEVELDDYGNPVEPPEPEDEEIDLDDEVKVRVPKDQAQKVREALLRQQDYTKKTTEVAEARKALAAERQMLHQSSQAELDTYAQAKSLEANLQAYAQVDWRTYMATDPVNAQADHIEYQQARDAYQASLQRLSGLRQQRLSHAQQETAKRLEEGRASLARDVPDWSDARKSTLVDMAANDFGFDRDEIGDLEADPRVARVLNELHELREFKRKAGAASNNAKAQVATPAAKVAAKATPPVGVTDDLPVDEWMKRENARVARRNKRR